MFSKSDARPAWYSSLPGGAASTGFSNSQPPSLGTIVLPDVEHGSGQLLAKAVWNSRNRVRVLAATGERLGRFALELESGTCLPVGDRDYVRRAMAIAGIEPPAWNCYPSHLDSHMLFRAHRTTASGALGWPKPIFVKPLHYGRFDGFVIRGEPGEMSQSDHRQLETLLSLPRSEPVWVCNPLAIRSTWRYLVHFGEVLGYARVSGPADVEPAVEEVGAIVAAGPSHAAYALEMGILDDGATTLLRTVDAWGLPFPASGQDGPQPLPFLRMLWARWCELHQRAHPELHEVAGSPA